MLLFLTLNNDVTQIILDCLILLFCVMAALQFSVSNWLRAADWSMYEITFLEHGYDSYDSIVSLLEADLGQQE